MKTLLLKLSGEAFSGAGGQGFDHTVLGRIAEEISSAYTGDLRLGIVVGGGNFLRGKLLQKFNIPPVQADFMGMIATVINALALQAVLEKRNIPVKVLSGIRIPQVVQEFSLSECKVKTEGVTVFSGGTGNPFLTTDTAASLRAAQFGSDMLLKGTQVDGVYSTDPKKDSSAQFFEQLTFQEVLHQRLQIMDLTAITLCMDNMIPVRVFNIQKPGNLYKALKGEKIGTLITSNKECL